MNKWKDFYFVHYIGYEDRTTDEIVLYENLRLVNMRDGPSIEGVSWASVLLPIELKSWSSTHNAEAQLKKIQEKCGLISIAIWTLSGKENFVLVGSKKAIKKGQSLLDVTIDNILEIQSYELQNWKILKQKEQ